MTPCNNAVACSTISCSNHSWKIFNPILNTCMYTYIWICLFWHSHTDIEWMEEKQTGTIHKNKLVQQTILQLSAHYMHVLTDIVHKTVQNATTLAFLCIELYFWIGKKNFSKKQKVIIKFHFKHIAGFLVIYLYEFLTKWLLAQIV